MVKVEIFIQVCVNGRPIWRKAKQVRKELSKMLTDKEYDKVLDAATVELTQHVKVALAAEKQKTPVPAQ